MLLRLDKIISNCGVCSRSDAERLIRGGSVLVNGVPARSGADKCDTDSAEIIVSGERIIYKKRVCLMLNKPEGVVTATEDRREKTVLDLLTGNYTRLGLFPVGRLDKETGGLLLLTNDGELAHTVISPKKEISKVYYAETDGSLTDADAEAFREGLELRDGLKCLPAELNIIEAGEKSRVLVTVREGKYHQVRRMLASRGAHVTRLRRLAIGSLELDKSLAPGAFRELTEAELALIFN